MCTYSMVHDFMRKNIHDDWWDRRRFEEYLDLIRRLEAIERRLDDKP